MCLDLCTEASNHRAMAKNGQLVMDVRLKLYLDTTLGELRALIVSTRPDLRFTLTILDSAGAISRASEGLPVVSNRKSPADSVPLGDPSKAVEVEKRIAVKGIPRLTFRMGTAPGIDSTALETLSAVGAKLLTRAIEQEEHTETMDRLIAEQRAVMDHISDGLLVLDRAGIVLHINEPAGRMLKLLGDASIGRPLSEMLDYETTIGEVFKNGEGYIDRELHIRSPVRRPSIFT